jgi:class 3 adenylate cyclase
VQPARIACTGLEQSDAQALQTIVRSANLGEAFETSLAAAHELVATRRIDLLVAGLAASNDDLFAVLRAAAPRAQGDVRLPVLVAAASDQAERIAALLQAGAEDFLALPLQTTFPLLVARRVELSLQRRRLRDVTIRLQASKHDLSQAAMLQIYNDASSRFIPREFLELLHRRSLPEVRLGDHVQSVMTIFFSDIRDFTTLSESLTPKQNFDFLNSYLRNVTPIIRAHHGFVDKYIGDAIMALFPRTADDALRAAVELQQQVERYNRGRSAAGYVPIRIGIGLHRGELILGTIGEEERMQTTVIADAVNVASRIEGLTKVFGVGLLASASVVEDLPKGHGFKLRHLGAVKAKGKTRSVEIYECYDNDPPELAEHKRKTAEIFAAAIAEFRRGMFLTAGKMFAHIAEMHPGDTVAAHYRDRCTLSVVHSRGRDRWEGADVIETS